MSPSVRSIRDRLSDLSRVSLSGCWEWTAYRNPGGYGMLKIDGKNRLAHRVAYEQYVGPIPVGLVLDHLCRDRGCINPDHLDPKTHRGNLLALGSLAAAASKAAQTHCVNGHEFTPENTYTYAYKARSCRSCVLERSRRRVV